MLLKNARAKLCWNLKRNFNSELQRDVSEWFPRCFIGSGHTLSHRKHINQSSHTVTSSGILFVLTVCSLEERERESSPNVYVFTHNVMSELRSLRLSAKTVQWTVFTARQETFESATMQCNTWKLVKSSKQLQISAIIRSLSSFTFICIAEWPGWAVHSVDSTLSSPYWAVLQCGLLRTHSSVWVPHTCTHTQANSSKNNHCLWCANKRPPPI